MSTTDPAYHAAPLVWLTKQVLHKDTTLADRVRQLRYKRRKAKPTLPPLEPQVPDFTPTTQLDAEIAALFDAAGEQPAGQVQEVGPLDKLTPVS